MRMRIRIIIYCLLIFSLLSCNKQDKIVIIFENVSGLTNTSEVFLQGLKVGQVEDFKIANDYKIIVTIEIEKNAKIPSDSKFEITSSLLGVKSINIIPGKSNKLFASSDTIIGTKENNISDSILTKSIINFIDSNSVTGELKRLNNNLEKIIEDKEK